MIQSVFTMSLQTAFLVFIAFSVIGWCAEVLYVGIFFEHKFVNRGFLHGPLCPVYGFGGMAILCLPSEILSTWVGLFLASMIFATAVEYFASWILEKTFDTLWWDYSEMRFNLNGRVCLLNSVLFGAMGILVVHFLEPLILKCIGLLDGLWLTVVYDAVVIILVVDILVTLRRLVDFHTAMERLHNIGDAVKAHYEKDIKNVEFFLKKFPTLKNIHHVDVIARLKERAKNLRKRG